MSFSDHKITAFTHRIADLPDQPNLPADELKERFDSSPEELRESVNGICDDADRLEERVSGIIAETFGDSIDKSMLSDELQDEIDAKATQTALAQSVTTEAAAREAGDEAEAAARAELAETVAQKCEIYCGTYTGNNQASQDINLGFQPKAVIIGTYSGERGDYITETVAMVAFPGVATLYFEITQTGFRVKDDLNRGASTGFNPYRYIAFR